MYIHIYTHIFWCSSEDLKASENAIQFASCQGNFYLPSCHRRNSRIVTSWKRTMWVGYKLGLHTKMAPFDDLFGHGVWVSEFTWHGFQRFRWPPKVWGWSLVTKWITWWICFFGLNPRDPITLSEIGVYNHLQTARYLASMLPFSVSVSEIGSLGQI